MNIKTVGIGGGLLALLAMSAWVLWPDEPKNRRSVAARASAGDDVEGGTEAKRKLIPSVARREQRLAARAVPSDAEPGDSPLVETNTASLGANQWLDEKYEQAYMYTGTAVSKEEQNAKKGIFTEETLRSREDELIRTNPEMKEAIEAERVARDVERERYTKSGGLSVEDEAIQKGVQLED